jgi:hypothetical protein
MDENTSNAIFNLMQNVVDKLDNIAEKVNKKGDTEISDVIIKNNNELKNLVARSLNNQNKIIQSNLEIESRIVESVEKNQTSPSVNNYAEYSVFGSKSHFKPLSLGLMLFGLILIWSSIKYLPSYINDRSFLKKEKEDYQFFYNYVYLNQFKNSRNVTADEFLKRIQEKDTLLINEYNTLLNTYKKEIKKQQLKEELKSLEKK